MAEKSLAHVKAPDSFADDLTILGKYQDFSAELLRVSLIGLSGIGVLALHLFFEAAGSDKPVHPLSAWVKFAIAASAFLLSGSAATALAHRFFSSDAIACQLKFLRLDIADRDSQLEGKDWEAALKRSTRAVAWSSALLAAAAFVFVVGLVLLMAA
jgi:hypothetical protein